MNYKDEITLVHLVKRYPFYSLAERYAIECSLAGYQEISGYGDRDGSLQETKLVEINYSQLRQGFPLVKCGLGKSRRFDSVSYRDPSALIE